MSKITVLEQKTFEGKPSGFKVTLDDGRNGNLQEKESDKGLRVGDEVTVKEIPYTSKKGVTSTLYGLRLNTSPTQTLVPTSSQSSPTAPQRPTINVGAGKSANELKADAAIAMAKACLQAVKDDKLDFGQVAEKQKFITKLLWEEIDEIFSNKG